MKLILEALADSARLIWYLFMEVCRPLSDIITKIRRNYPLHYDGEHAVRCCEASLTLFPESHVASYGPRNRAFLRILRAPGKARLVRINYCPFCGVKY